MNTNAGVCAVIVTYNPAHSLETNLAVLRPQVGGLVIVDNASRPATLPFLKRIVSQYSCVLIKNPENYGIGRALNQGIHSAEEQGFGWVALFDQDSTVSDSYIEEMMQVYKDSPNPSDVAVAAPQYIDRMSGKKFKFTLPVNGELLYAMTSGSLLNMTTFNDIGDHNEAFFIDYVDVEWSLRARWSGKKILESKNAKLLHSLGNLNYHRFLFRDIPVTNHSPARHYYRERNRWRVYMSGKYDSAWLRHDLYLHLTGFVATMLWEDDRWRKVKIILRGVIDALSGRMGKTVEL